MYFVVNITLANGLYAKECFDFPTIVAARANHHYFLTSSYSNSSLEYFMSVILDVDGNVIDREVYHAPVPVAEEE